MKISEVLKKVGSAAVKELVPGGGFLIDLVNDFLPAGEQLHPLATGEQVTAAIAAMPPDIKEKILSKQYDVEIAEINADVEKVKAMAEVDKAGASTRPHIALLMAYVVAIAEVLGVTFWAVAVLQEMMTVENSWPVLLSLLGPPMILLRAYFGDRRDEKKARYAAATGQGIPSTGIIGNLLKAISGG